MWKARLVDWHITIQQIACDLNYINTGIWHIICVWRTIFSIVYICLKPYYHLSNYMHYHLISFTCWHHTVTWHVKTHIHTCTWHVKDTYTHLSGVFSRFLLKPFKICPFILVFGGNRDETQVCPYLPWHCTRTLGFLSSREKCFGRSHKLHAGDGSLVI